MRQDRRGARSWFKRHESLSLYALVGAGAGIGGVARLLVSLAAIDIAGPEFPWGTLIANIAGSFAIGFYAALSGPGGRHPNDEKVRHFVMTGLCGGFTTFSVFSLEMVQYLAGREYALAGGYLGASMAMWLVAVWLGFAWARRINRATDP
ncbi:MAG TPA: CrcB family protein [Aurantimonas sp.]|nr:CrcB family protein [Aurantimonas sp.]